MFKWNVQQSPRQQIFDIWFETRRCFIVSACPLYSWNIPLARSKQSDGVTLQWNTSADDYLLGNNKYTVKWSKALLLCRKQAGLEVNTQNAVWTGCMLNSQHNDTGNSENGGGGFKYLGTILANQNGFQSRLTF
jgi:hypothetical protein